MSYKTANYFEEFNIANYVSKNSTLLRKIQQVFERDLKPDMYDIRRERIEIVSKSCQLTKEEEQELFETYYINGDSKKINSLVKKLLPTEKECYDNLEPYRERAFSKLFITISKNDSISIEIAPNKKFSQSGNDYRTLPRLFPSLSKKFLNDHELHDLLRKIVKRIQTFNPKAKKFKFEFHVMRLRVNQIPKSNSPEGFHQDGAHYIMMFIANRKNISGAVSRVAEKMSDGSFKTLTEFIIEPGKGLFMSDAYSSLYHMVTEAKSIDSSKDGIRDLFGFDMSILE